MIKITLLGWMMAILNPDPIPSWICVRNAISGKDFVGLCFEENQTIVTLPLGHPLPHSMGALREDIETIFLLMDSARHSGFSNAGLESPECDLSSLRVPSAYLTIIRDYMHRNGLIVELDNEWSRLDTGRIDWPRSLRSSLPLISDSGLYFPEIIRKKSTRLDNGPLSEAHAFCLREALDRLGWLFGFDVSLNPRILSYREKCGLLDYVQRVRKNIFNDRDLVLIDAIVDILSDNISGSADEPGLLGTEYFHVIWEYAIHRIFSNISLDAYLPRVLWSNGDVDFSPTPMRPDTIYVGDNKFFIIDSKYYTFGITRNIGDLPGTYDVAKQIIYAEKAAAAFSEELDYRPKTIINVFIIPGRMRTACQLEIAASALPNWLDGSRSFDTVHTIVVDSRSILRDAQTGNVNSWREKLELTSFPVSK